MKSRIWSSQSLAVFAHICHRFFTVDFVFYSPEATWFSISVPSQLGRFRPGDCRVLYGLSEISERLVWGETMRFLFLPLFLVSHLTKGRQWAVMKDEQHYLMGWVRRAVFKSSTILFFISVSSSSKAYRVCICSEKKMTIRKARSAWKLRDRPGIMKNNYPINPCRGACWPLTRKAAPQLQNWIQMRLLMWTGSSIPLCHTG